ncbi:hypothetical protein RF11_01395 [Thelohanellus kitauei]|uniref:Uncharacterized protein n=1 Tax=Thelohanellus kitauei TaxID=669202 RepID=A0A0C2N6C0_THEKT|nr:hypothetical protein RF11_01395 [Thelohanellus kitauei]
MSNIERLEKPQRLPRGIEGLPPVGGAKPQAPGSYSFTKVSVPSEPPQKAHKRHSRATHSTHPSNAPSRGYPWDGCPPYPPHEPEVSSISRVPPHTLQQNPP